MKKTIIYTAFIWAISATVLTSCEDMFGSFLDKQPSNELTEDQVFSEWETTKQFHFDTYNFLRHGASRINNSWMELPQIWQRPVMQMGEPAQVSISETIMPQAEPVNDRYMGTLLSRHPQMQYAAKPDR